MSALYPGGHVSLLLCSDQVDRTHCVMTSVLLKFALSFATIAVLQTSVQDSHRSIVRSGWSSLGVSPFAIWCS